MPTSVPAAGPFVQTFAPELWGEAEKFVRFAPFTYEFKEAQARALEGIVGHFRKAAALKRVARRLEEGLALDRDEVQTQGYSEARRSEEFAAVVEEVFGELYACLDCARQVLKVVYPKARGMKDKTSKLFDDAAAGKTDPIVPAAIVTALALAHNDWFWELRRIRTAVTHLSPGDCSPGEEKGKVAYFNRALGRSGNSLEIKDVWGEIERYFGAVNDLLGSVFHELNATLTDQRVQKVCGFYEGRVYQRSVSPVEVKDFDSGVCASYEWFEKDENPTCPMSGTCGAYARAGRRTNAE